MEQSTVLVDEVQHQNPCTFGFWLDEQHTSGPQKPSLAFENTLIMVNQYILVSASGGDVEGHSLFGGGGGRLESSGLSDRQDTLFSGQQHSPSRARQRMLPFCVFVMECKVLKP